MDHHRTDAIFVVNADTFVIWQVVQLDSGDVSEG